MRLKPSFRLNRVAGEYILLDTEVDTIDMRKVFSMNEPAAWLWKKIGDSSFDERSLVDMICSEYDVSAADAERDVANLIRLWREYGMLI